MRRIVVLALVAACGGSAPTLNQQLGVETWGQADHICNQTAGNRGQADYCHDQLRELFCSPDGGVFADSGGCQNITLSNGMRP